LEVPVGQDRLTYDCGTHEAPLTQQHLFKSSTAGHRYDLLIFSALAHFSHLAQGVRVVELPSQVGASYCHAHQLVCFSHRAPVVQAEKLSSAESVFLKYYLLHTFFEMYDFCSLSSFPEYQVVRIYAVYFCFVFFFLFFPKILERSFPLLTTKEGTRSRFIYSLIF
jgi:hypothetical protein